MEGGAVKGGPYLWEQAIISSWAPPKKLISPKNPKRGRFGGKTEKTTIKTTAVPVRIRGAGNIRFYSTKQNGKGAILLAGSTIESNNTSIELEAVVCGTASDHFEERVKKSGGNHVTGKKRAQECDILRARGRITLRGSSRCKANWLERAHKKSSSHQDFNK